MTDGDKTLALEQSKMDDLYAKGEALASQLNGPVHAATSAAAKSAQEARLARLDQLLEALEDRSRLLAIGRVDFSGGSHAGRTVYIGRTLIGDPDEEYPPMSSWKAEVAGAFYNPLGFEGGSAVDMKRTLVGKDRLVEECVDENPQQLRDLMQRKREEDAAAAEADEDLTVEMPAAVPVRSATDTNVADAETPQLAPDDDEDLGTGTGTEDEADATAHRTATSPRRIPPSAPHPGARPVVPVTPATPPARPPQKRDASRPSVHERPPRQPQREADRVVGSNDAEAGSDVTTPTVAGFVDPLIRRLLERTGTRLAPIVETIQARQYELMERPIERNLVIQGGPGTGKTVIALHRIAVQLYRSTGQLSQSDILFVGPSRTFVGYVDNVLPSLGEHAVVHRAVQDLATHGAVPNGHDAADAALVKGLPQMATVIDRFLRGRARIERREIRLGDGALAAVAPDALRPVLEQAKTLAKNYGELRARFRQLLTSDEVLRQIAAHDGPPDGRIVLDHALADALAEDTVPTLSARAVIHDMLTSPNLLEVAAESLLSLAQQATIRRRAATVGQHPWTYEDFPLLDEAAEQLGSERRPRRYTHVVIDEAQDFSAMQLRMVARRSSGGITVLGDLAQATTGWSPATWDEHLGSGGIEVDDLEELAQSYRTTRPILEAANLLLLVIDLGLEPPRAVITEGVPVRATPLDAPSEDAHALATVVTSMIERVRVTETIGIIGPEQTLERIRPGLEAAGLSFRSVQDEVSARLVLVPVDEAKGLEFDHVLLMEPERIHRADPATGPRKLYVAMTRARKSLHLFHRDRLPRVLASSDAIELTAPVPPPRKEASSESAMPLAHAHGDDEETATELPDDGADGGTERIPPRLQRRAGSGSSEVERRPLGPCTLVTGEGMVVLTDHPGVGRLHLIEHAERLGLAVRTEVTSATTLVVVGDVTSSSRRARLARELGVPIATTKQLLATNPGGEISAEVQPPKKS